MNRPTIDDVAALAGVGRTTVSRVLNDQPNVRPQVRARVLAAVDKLGFQVNLQARNLAGGNAMRIALVHGIDPALEHFSYFCSALELSTMRSGLSGRAQIVTHVAVFGDPAAAAEILARVAAERCDGVILIPPFTEDPALLQALERLAIPVVCMAGGDVAETMAVALGIDEFKAGHDIGMHLAGLGHRRFGYIRGPAEHTAADRRFEGFLAAVAKVGVAPAEVASSRGTFTFRSGMDCAHEILAAVPDITALVCANDDMAAGALLAAHRTGRRIPQELAVTGFDDTPMSEVVWPPLTTIRQPLLEMGAKAVELLLEMTQEPAGAGQAYAPRREVMPHRLIVRESTLALA